jgi:HK97 family phage portal protein
MRIGDAYACVRALSEAAASLPLIVYRRAGTGRERIEGPTADLLRNPAPGTTQSGLIGQVVAHLNLWGNAYLGKVRDTDGVITQLTCLPPDAIQVEIVAGEPRFTYYRNDRAPTKHTLADIVHIRALSTDGVLGLSPVRMARDVIGLNSQLVQHASRFFANDARPSGVLQVQAQGPAAQDQLEELKTAWNARHGGSANAHRIAILSGDVEFKPLSMPLEDAQFLQQRQLSAQEVCRVFRVPPWVVGAPVGDSLTYATTEQQGLAFVTYSLRPWLVAIEQALSADGDLFGPNQYAEFLVDALLRADSSTRADVYATALQNGWMTVQEVRERENLPPLPALPTLPASLNGNGAEPVTQNGEA